MDSNELLESILSLQPAQSAGDGSMSLEEKTLALIQELIESIPVSIDLHVLKYKFRNDDNPLSVVLV